MIRYFFVGLILLANISVFASEERSSMVNRHLRSLGGGGGTGGGTRPYTLRPLDPEAPYYIQFCSGPADSCIVRLILAPQPDDPEDLEEVGMFSLQGSQEALACLSPSNEMNDAIVELLPSNNTFCYYANRTFGTMPTPVVLKIGTIPPQTECTMSDHFNPPALHYTCPTPMPTTPTSIPTFMQIPSTAPSQASMSDGEIAAIVAPVVVVIAVGAGVACWKLLKCYRGFGKLIQDTRAAMAGIPHGSYGDLPE